MERHNVSRLVGAPPGYVGFDEGGQLTEAVRRKSYAVILLDEIEKAHAEVFNILLQILEDGHLTDAKGRRVDFRNTIIIMTSNLGAAKIQTNSSLGFRQQGDTVETRAAASYELMKEKVQTELKTNFRPEFLNRIDATVVFRSLTVEEITQIVDLMLKRVRDQLKAQGMNLEITQPAKEHLIKLGYDAGVRRPAAAPDDPEPDRGPARRAPAAGPVQPGRDDPGRSRSRRQRPGHRGHRGEDPGRSLTAGREPRVARVQSRFVCQSCGAAVPRWEGPVPLVRRVEHPRRDRRPRRAAPPAGRRRRRGRARSRCPTPRRRARRSGGPSASASSIGSSAAASSPARSSSWVASPASASRRCCSRPRPGSPRGAGVLYATGEESVAQVRLRAARLGLTSRTRGGPHPRRRRDQRRPDRGPRARGADRAARRRLGADRGLGRARRAAGERRPGPRGGAAADGAREGRRRAGRARRARDQGRHARRARRPSSTWSTSCSPSRATGPAGCAWSARRRTGTGRPRRSACSRWPSGAWSRSPTRRARSSPTTTRPAPGQRRRAGPRGLAAAARRGPGAGRAERRAVAAPDRVGDRLQPARAAGRRPRTARGHRPVGPRRLRQPRRRPDRRRARPRPAARPRARVVAARPAAASEARSPSARSACWASCARSAASTGGCARRRAWASRGRSCPGRAPIPTTASAGVEIIVVGSLAEAIRAALADPMAAVRELV